MPTSQGSARGQWGAAGLPLSLRCQDWFRRVFPFPPVSENARRFAGLFIQSFIRSFIHSVARSTACMSPPCGLGARGRGERRGRGRSRLCPLGVWSLRTTLDTQQVISQNGIVPPSLRQGCGHTGPGCGRSLGSVQEGPPGRPRGRGRPEAGRPSKGARLEGPGCHLPAPVPPRWARAPSGQEHSAAGHRVDAPGDPGHLLPPAAARPH